MFNNFKVVFDILCSLLNTSIFAADLDMRVSLRIPTTGNEESKKHSTRKLK